MEPIRQAQRPTQAPRPESEMYDHIAFHPEPLRTRLGVAERRSRRRVFGLFRALGLPVSAGKSIPEACRCPWFEGELRGWRVVYGAPRSRARVWVADLWHELGHALIAPVEGWSLPGWGLGPVYDGQPGGRRLRDGATEALASALGIWLHRAVGRDTPEVRRHIEHHDWGCTGAEAWRHLRQVLAFQQTLQVGQRAHARLMHIRCPSPFGDSPC